MCGGFSFAKIINMRAFCAASEINVRAFCAASEMPLTKMENAYLVDKSSLQSRVRIATVNVEKACVCSPRPAKMRFACVRLLCTNYGFS
jgi:hypothetical protein